MPGKLLDIGCAAGVAASTRGSAKLDKVLNKVFYEVLGKVGR